MSVIRDNLRFGIKKERFVCLVKGHDWEESEATHEIKKDWYWRGQICLVCGKMDPYPEDLNE